MRNNILSGAVFILLLALLPVTGCKKSDVNEQHYDNKAYISASSFTDQILFSDEQDSYSREVTVSIAKPEEHDITMEIRTAPELLETYRTAYYDDAVELLPDGICTISDPQLRIVAGSVSSAATVVFSNVSSLDMDTKYVMPVTVDNVSGIDFLGSARTMYFIFRGASLINVVCNLSENRAWPEWDNFEQVRDMSTFTLEALVNPATLNKQISTIMGIEGKFLLRIGDSGLSPDQLQVVVGSLDVTNTDMKIPAGEWTHVAVSFDSGNVKVYLNGELKGEETFYSPQTINFDVPHSDESGSTITRCFWVGYSFEDARYFDGNFSEVRIWNKVLTADEINASGHFYKVDPESEGLVAYWKFDDGIGKVARDYSVYGNDLTIETDPEWVPVSIPER